MSMETLPTGLGASKDLPLLRRSATVAANGGDVVIRHLRDEIKLEGTAAHLFNKISAELKNGVLTIHLPKSEAVKPRRISVNSA